MKTLMVLLFIFSAQAYSPEDPRVGRPMGKNPATPTEFKDEVVKGQSAEDRRTYPPGSLQDINNGAVTGTQCKDANGRGLSPKDKGYKKCVDQANRVK